MSKEDVIRLQIQLDDAIRERDDMVQKCELVTDECKSLRVKIAEMSKNASELENLKSLNAILSSRINELEDKLKAGTSRSLTPQAKAAYHATAEFGKIFRKAVEDPQLLIVKPNLVFDTSHLPRKDGMKELEEDWSRKASAIMAEAFEMELKIAGEIVRIREKILNEHPRVAKLLEKAPDYVWFE